MWVGAVVFGMSTAVAAATIEEKEKNFGPIHLIRDPFLPFMAQDHLIVAEMSASHHKKLPDNVVDPKSLSSK